MKSPFRRDERERVSTRYNVASRTPGRPWGNPLCSKPPSRINKGVRRQIARVERQGNTGEAQRQRSVAS